MKRSKSRRVSIAATMLSIATTTTQVGATVIDVEVLPGNGAFIPDGYGGLDWDKQGTELNATTSVSVLNTVSHEATSPLATCFERPLAFPESEGRRSISWAFT